MRIITGSAKGVRLKTPQGMETRPTSDRVKESLFNILSNRVLDAMVLDLFAGTGNLGLEALSRGAAQAIFVDRSFNSINLIKDNASLTKLADRAECYKSDVFSALSKICQAKQQFDLIFCDPPYNQGFVDKILQVVDNAEILAEDGILMIEHSKHEKVLFSLQKIEMIRTEKYGGTLISFFIRRNRGGL